MLAGTLIINTNKHLIDTTLTAEIICSSNASLRCNVLLINQTVIRGKARRAKVCEGNRTILREALTDDITRKY